MKRTHEDAMKTRDDIFWAGLRVISQNGYRSAKMEDIAQEAGVTRGAIYWHFKNKEAFIDEIKERTKANSEEILSRLEKEDGLDSIRYFIKRILTDFVKNNHIKLMNEVSFQFYFNRPKEELKCELESLAEVHGKRFDRLMAEGKVYPFHSGTQAFLSLLTYLNGIILHITALNITLTEKEIDDYAEFAVRGFTPSNPLEEKK